MVDSNAAQEELISCTRKERYVSRKKADAARLHAVPGKEIRVMNTYHCQYCNGFHIGHKPGSGRKRRTDKTIKRTEYIPEEL